MRPLIQSREPIGLLFSGGVDSALLAWELRSRTGVVLSTMGRAGSPDLRAGEESAARVGLPWEKVALDESLVVRALDRFSTELEGLSSLSRSILLALAIAIEGATPQRLVCGQGVDELFLGYAHYRNLSELGAARRSQEDLTRLRATDWPRTQRIAAGLGKEVVAPYLAPSFEAAATQVPIALRLPDGLPKRFFREWAMSRGLPPELARRPKKALQYGSGLDALLRSLPRPGP